MTEELSVLVMVEIPKGGRNKYEYNKEHKCLEFNRMLFSSVHYPSDYGFILDTLAEDGDALDALVLMYEPTFPGCLIQARPIGMLKMTDEHGMDEKVLCVPLTDPYWNHVHNLSEVPPHLLKEIEHFFSIYKDLEQKTVTIYGWEGLESTIEVYNRSKARFEIMKRNEETIRKAGDPL